MNIKKYFSVVGILQIVFWIAFVFFAVYSFSLTSTLRNSLQRICAILPLHLFLFYTCYLYLIPHYFEKKKFALFFTLLILLLMIVILIRMVIRQEVNDLHFAGKIDISETSQWVIIIISELAIVLISCLLAVAKQKYQIEKKYTEAQTQYLQNEMNFLKGQISPHFLLNSLNNIYSFAVTKSPETPNAILQLAELLKYFLYESSEQKISVKRELDIIKYYINLFQQRLQTKANIVLDINETCGQKEMEPLILMGLVENAFKHSGIGINENAFIKMNAEIQKDRINFSIKNSTAAPNNTVSEYGGIGLANIKKRLEINYRDKHQITIKTEKDFFMVTVNIPLL
ncbi:MAG: sensor histidine kinase [Ferruginibacter sp.]